MELVRRARAEGLPVTCDVSVNQLHLTDIDIGYFDAAMRLVPPLRQQRDRDTIRAALADGTIDALVSDHTPVDEDAKTLPFAEAEPGATGLELLLSLALHWGAAAKVPLIDTLARVTARPAAIAGWSAGVDVAAGLGRLCEGGIADLCVFDPEESWVVRRDALRSQGKHTPFAGYELPGRVRWTIVDGRLAYEAADAATPC